VADNKSEEVSLPLVVVVLVSVARLRPLWFDDAAFTKGVVFHTVLLMVGLGVR
jgi:hypothetical protein